MFRSEFNLKLFISATVVYVRVQLWYLANVDNYLKYIFLHETIEISAFYG